MSVSNKGSCGDCVVLTSDCIKWAVNTHRNEFVKLMSEYVINSKEKVKLMQ